MTQGNATPQTGITELERIYRETDTQLALDVTRLFSEVKADKTPALDKAALDAYLAKLPAEVAEESAKVQQILSNPGTRINPNLKHPAARLAWAAGLGYLYKNSPPNTIRGTTLWKTIMRAPEVAGSLNTAARILEKSLTERNATMGYGTPGSHFYHDPLKHHINIDLFKTLVAGFGDEPMPGMKGVANAVYAMLHEVGHSLYSTRWTDKLNAVKKSEDDLIAKGKARKLAKMGKAVPPKGKQGEEDELQEVRAELTPDEYKQVARLRKEWTLRHDLWNRVEDNCVNSFAVRQGKHLPYNLAQALNVGSLTLQGLGNIIKRFEEKGAKPPIDPNDPEYDIKVAKRMISQLRTATGYAFHSTNGLFDTKDVDTWRKLGVEPSSIRGVNGETFDDLMKMCIGPKGMSALQPDAGSGMLKQIFARSVASYADKRCEIIDKIWEVFAAPYAEALLDQAEQKAEEKMNKKKEKGKDKDKQQGQGEGEGEGDSQDGESQEGQGKGKGKGKGKKQKGQQGGDSSPSQGGDEDGDESSPSQGGDDDDSSEGGDNSVDVEGVGEMGLDDGAPTDSPEASRKSGRKGSEKENNDPSRDAKSLRDLAKEAKKQADKAAEDAAKQEGDGKDGDGQDKDADGEGKQGGKNPSDKDSPPNFNMDQEAPGGRGRGVDLQDLSSNDWTNFKRGINALEPVVASVAEEFKYIRRQQRQVIRAISKKEREQTLRGGDLHKRLDMYKQVELASKRATRQKIEQCDREVWKKDDLQTEMTSVELWILGDGSGSMSFGLPGGGRRIDSAVQSMAVLYESGRRAGFDVLIGMWGDEELRVMAAPGDSDRKVGENFQKVKDGLGSGTQLSYAFNQAVEKSAKQELGADGKVKRFAGMTHFLIISDGELNPGDIEPTIKMMKKLLRYGPRVSIDVAVLGAGTGAEMAHVINAVKEEFPGAPVGILNATSARDIPLLLAKQIRRRFERSSNGVKAVPDSQKREALARAARLMKQG